MAATASLLAGRPNRRTRRRCCLSHSAFSCNSCSTTAFSCSTSSTPTEHRLQRLLCLTTARLKSLENSSLAASTDQVSRDFVLCRSAAARLQLQRDAAHGAALNALHQVLRAAAAGQAQGCRSQRCRSSAFTDERQRRTASNAPS